MNYTLKQLQERLNKLIEQQGEDAQYVADSFNLWHDKWNTLATAHVIENN